MSVSDGTEEVFEELTPTPDHRDKDMFPNTRKLSANICTGKNQVLSCVAFQANPSVKCQPKSSVKAILTSSVRTNPKSSFKPNLAKLSICTL